MSLPTFLEDFWQEIDTLYASWYVTLVIGFIAVEWFI